ncbi:MAG: type II toxin-antitoxin system RelE/ParE family toxin [Cycloclasticus sp.]|nr:type II toxin-antitoxin system RelE/ParE family toxin [Cycloclasticus sp.]
MIYDLEFITLAKKEWDSLDNTIRKQFKKKLIERLKNPKVPKSKLNGIDDCYKIKLRRPGFRLVYQVKDVELIVLVVSVGKREKNHVYKQAIKRI